MAHKTHLDVGFTDLAARVVDRYLGHFLPASLATAARLRAEGGPDRLCWTVGSWLVVEALERADADQRSSIEAGIAAGDLAWHAWPFTTHTGLLDPSLATHALTLSARLDRWFGRTTVAAKMTDVPGHPRALVPILAEAGVRLLHLGVNPASTPPRVPPVFRWRDPPSGAEVVVIYQRGGYGGAQVLPGADAVLVVEHTGDNLGPPTPEGVAALGARLRRTHPGADVRAARLDDAWSALERAGAVAELPVVEDELGDTWIHGAGTDPAKLARYRALARLRAAAVADGTVDPGPLGTDDPDLDRASRHLLLVAEHTWGLDEKTHWPDTTTWSTGELAEARAHDARVAAMEASWAEQRAYVDAAASALTATAVGPTAVDQALAGTAARRPDLRALAPLDPGREVHGAHLVVAVDARTGAITRARTADGVDLAAPDHPIGELGYQTFDDADYERWWSSYVDAADEDEWWARQDQTKPGLGASGAVSRWWRFVPTGWWSGRIDDAGAAWVGERGRVLGPGMRLVERLEGPTAAVERLGCPPEVWLVVDLPDDDPALLVDLRWFDKPATRCPEATWLRLHPRVDDAAAWRLDVLGEPLDPDEVVDDGGRDLHAIGRGAVCGADRGSVAIESLDAGLVAPGRPCLLAHRHGGGQDLAGAGLSLLLHDNVWGTNFPMWSEGDARFRVAVDPSAAPWWAPAGVRPPRGPGDAEGCARGGAG